MLEADKNAYINHLEFQATKDKVRTNAVKDFAAFCTVMKIAQDKKENVNNQLQEYKADNKNAALKCGFLCAFLTGGALFASSLLLTTLSPHIAIAMATCTPFLSLFVGMGSYGIYMGVDMEVKLNKLTEAVLDARRPAVA